MRSMALAIALALALISPLAPAKAQDASPDAEPQDMVWLDAKFGEYVVTPLANALFFDIIFWDNTLDEGEGIGQIIDGREVMAYEDGAYILAKRWSADTKSARLLGLGGKSQRFGSVTVTLKEGKGGAYLGVVPEAPLTLRTQDIEKLTPFLESQARGDLRITVPGIDLSSVYITELAAPFPIPVMATDLGEGDIEGAAPTLAYRSVPSEVTLPKDLLKITKGATVALPGKNGAPGAQAQVLAVNGATLDVRSIETTKDSELTLPNTDGITLPLVVAWLVLGAIFFTLRMQFINIRGFGHAIQVTMGKFDDEHQPGEISHFQALSSALSATVGLGNIAGVAIAVSTGGPGAIFWMIMAGFLGMSSKFVECTLGQMYRIVDTKGNVRGGPMEYLPRGLEELGVGRLGKVLGFVFVLMCIGGSFGGGNMFQANQSYQAVADAIPWFKDHAVVYGLILAALVGVVIIGGVKRIGAAASLIVPAMCGIYVLAGLYILLVNAGQVPTAIAQIVGEAFTPEAGMGGFVGVLVTGFQRAAFSNEAGVGSASIAHSAAATDEPVREGIVALLEPFIDTIVVCTMTGLVVVITGAYKSGAGDGVLMTSAAFGSVIDWFPILLTVAVVLFAFSTMISWSYYGERCFTRLFGPNSSMVYRVIFLAFVVFGSVFELGNVLGFSDLMILGMAFPNILGLVLLSGKVRAALDNYWGRFKSGEMQPKS